MYVHTMYVPSCREHSCLVWCGPLEPVLVSRVGRHSTFFSEKSLQDHYCHRPSQTQLTHTRTCTYMLRTNSKLAAHLKLCRQGQNHPAHFKAVWAIFKLFGAIIAVLLNVNIYIHLVFSCAHVHAGRCTTSTRNVKLPRRSFLSLSLKKEKCMIMSSLKRGWESGYCGQRN